MTYIYQKYNTLYARLEISRILNNNYYQILKNDNVVT